MTAAPSSPSTSAATTEGAVTTVPAGPAAFVQTGPASSGAVALTFHTAGDPIVVGRLADELRRLEVRATLFLVGTWLRDHAPLARRLQADGHELANHTFTHPSLGRLAGPAVLAEITRCRDVLDSTVGTPGRWFRPSAMDVPTALVREEAARAGYGTVVGYSVDPLDYQDPGSAAVVSRVKARLTPGAIVSLHTLYEGTVAALDPMVHDIRSAGLRTATVSELIGGA